MGWGASDQSCLVAKGLSNHRAPLLQSSGGRTWWAHFEFTRVNIEPTIRRKKVEELSEAGATSLNTAA